MIHAFTKKKNTDITFITYLESVADHITSLNFSFGCGAFELNMYIDCT